MKDRAIQLVMLSLTLNLLACVGLTAASNVCWLTVTYGVSTPGGVYVNGVNTQEACFLYCISSPDRCQAVDFLVANSQCWSHPSNLLVQTDSRDIARYEYTCNHATTCVDNFEKFIDVRPADTTQGVLSHAVFEETCKDECLANANCKRVVSSRDGLSCGTFACYLYTSWSGESARIVDAPGTVVYLRKICLRSDTQLTPTVTPASVGSTASTIASVGSTASTIASVGSTASTTGQILFDGPDCPWCPPRCSDCPAGTQCETCCLGTDNGCA